MRTRPLSVVDLFSGCGGLSYGFSASGHFRIEVAIDVFSEALQTFKINHEESSPEIICRDIRAVSNREIISLVRGRGVDEVDVVIGGPPCEGFSQNKRREFVDHQGKRRFGRNLSFASDPRNYLFREYVRIIGALRPKMILMENVPQILNHSDGAVRDEILVLLRQLGYIAQAKVLLASNYGVPQNRRRAFFLGVREDLHRANGFCEWPSPTHSPDTSDDLALVQHLSAYISVRNAIGDLPFADESGERRPYDAPPDNDYARRMRQGATDVSWHIARTPGAAIVKRLHQMTPGMRLDHLPEEFRTKSYYFNAYGRLDWDRPAKTITKSCNYLGSGCFGHPILNRGITMREAARLQSFPDRFEFVGTSEPVVARQIGGAVPPLLAEAIARPIASYLARFVRGDAVSA